jgi:hypothetical protein
MHTYYKLLSILGLGIFCVACTAYAGIALAADVGKSSGASYHSIKFVTAAAVGADGIRAAKAERLPFRFRAFSSSLWRWGAWHEIEEPLVGGKSIDVRFQEAEDFGNYELVQIELEKNTAWRGRIETGGGDDIPRRSESVSIYGTQAILRLHYDPEDSDPCEIEDLECVIILTSSCLPDAGICCKHGVCTCSNEPYCN